VLVLKRPRERLIPSRSNEYRFAFDQSDA